MRDVSSRWNDVKVEILAEDDDAGAILEDVRRGVGGEGRVHGLVIVVMSRSDGRRDLAEEVEHVLKTDWVELDAAGSVNGV